MVEKLKYDISPITQVMTTDEQEMQLQNFKFCSELEAIVFVNTSKDKSVFSQLTADGFDKVFERGKRMIRRATESDLEEIASVHSCCFPNSMSTKLGRLDAFYRYYLNESPSMFFVAVNNNDDIIGFCVGYRSDKKGINKQYEKQNRVHIAIQTLILLFKCDRVVWEKIIYRLFGNKKSVVTDKTYIGVPADMTGDLMSICILPQYRGGGMASDLLERYIDELRIQKLKRCILTVDITNERGIGFYRKHLFVPYRKTAGKSITMARMLGSE